MMTGRMGTSGCASSSGRIVVHLDGGALEAEALVRLVEQLEHGARDRERGAFAAALVATHAVATRMHVGRLLVASHPLEPRDTLVVGDLRDEFAVFVFVVTALSNPVAGGRRKQEERG